METPFQKFLWNKHFKKKKGVKATFLFTCVFKVLQMDLKFKNHFLIKGGFTLLLQIHP